MKTTKGNVASLIPTIRKAASALSLAELAKRTRIPKTSLHRFMQGEDNPKLQLLDAVAGELGFRFELRQAKAGSTRNGHR